MCSSSNIAYSTTYKYFPTHVESEYTNVQLLRYIPALDFFVDTYIIYVILCFEFNI